MHTHLDLPGRLCLPQKLNQQDRPNTLTPDPSLSGFPLCLRVSEISWSSSSLFLPESSLLLDCSAIWFRWMELLKFITSLTTTESSMYPLAFAAIF